MPVVIQTIEMAVRLKDKAFVYIEGFDIVKRLGKAITVRSLVYGTERVKTDFKPLLIGQLRISINTLRVRLKGNSRDNQLAQYRRT